jgi:hypothetical protein
VVRAGLEVFDKPAERVALLTDYLEALKQAEKVEQGRYEANRCGIAPVHRARYERLEAEVGLLRAKREAGIKRQWRKWFAE